MSEKFQILKCLVGSHAHGLNSADSDKDYRGVYITPTSEILSLNHKYKGNNWMEGVEDNTTYELHHFLSLAMKCNPSILEVFVAPIVKEDPTEDNWGLSEYGGELRDLFPYIWNPKGVYDAFVGYGLSQQKKMLDNHLGRWQKYAIAYLRTLKNLIDLLKTETFSLYIEEGEFRDKLIYIKEGKYAVGDIINMANDMIEEAKEALPKCINEPSYEKVNNFLIKMRKEFF